MIHTGVSSTSTFSVRIFDEDTIQPHRHFSLPVHPADFELKSPEELYAAERSVLSLRDLAKQAFIMKLAIFPGLEAVLKNINHCLVISYANGDLLLLCREEDFDLARHGVDAESKLLSHDEIRSEIDYFGIVLEGDFGGILFFKPRYMLSEEGPSNEVPSTEGYNPNLLPREDEVRHLLLRYNKHSPTLSLREFEKVLTRVCGADAMREGKHYKFTSPSGAVFVFSKNTYAPTDPRWFDRTVEAIIALKIPVVHIKERLGIS